MCVAQQQSATCLACWPPEQVRTPTIWWCIIGLEQYPVAAVADVFKTLWVLTMNLKMRWHHCAIGICGVPNPLLRYSVPWWLLDWSACHTTQQLFSRPVTANEGCKLYENHGWWVSIIPSTFCIIYAYSSPFPFPFPSHFDPRGTTYCTFAAIMTRYFLPFLELNVNCIAGSNKTVISIILRSTVSCRVVLSRIEVICHGVSKLEDSPVTSVQTGLGKPSETAGKQKGESILEKSTAQVICKGPCSILHMIAQEYQVHMWVYAHVGRGKNQMRGQKEVRVWAMGDGHKVIGRCNCQCVASFCSQHPHSPQKRASSSLSKCYSRGELANKERAKVRAANIVHTPLSSLSSWQLPGQLNLIGHGSYRLEQKGVGGRVCWLLPDGLQHHVGHRFRDGHLR